MVLLILELLGDKDRLFMKKRCIWLFIFVLLMNTACGSAESRRDDPEKTGDALNDRMDNIQDVIFLNNILEIGYDAEAIKANILQDEYYEPSSDNQLYAFVIKLERYYDGELDFPEDYPNSSAYESPEDFYVGLFEYKSQAAAALAKNSGLYVLSDYPYAFYNQPDLIFEVSDADKRKIDTLSLGDCAVAGTLAQIKKIFDNTDSIENWFCIAEPASRPDFLDILKTAGLEKTDYYSEASSWYYNNIELVKPLLGSENQVNMSVIIE